MWGQMNAIGKASWDSFIELKQISAMSMERAAEQEFVFMGDCAAMVLHYLEAPTQVNDVPSKFGDEIRAATEYREKWMANAQRVWENYLQTQNELGEWLKGILHCWVWRKVTEQAQQTGQADLHSQPCQRSLAEEQSTFVVNDPMLALLTRFACGDGQLHLAHEEFMLDQIATIQRYVALFPAEQQNRVALEWIEQYAERYRQAWQKKAVSAQAARTRCPDCPLADEGLTANCGIHRRWLDLLNRYIADELSSKRYVERTLGLLTDHKRRLKVSALRGALS
ncbi:MAG: phasin family protein [Betaproteobacteria bacterium]|nr:phasin family protein [Betaproteobacteria bacterium]